MWIAHTLRRFRGVATDPAPLWFHLGYLHALAASAAIRAGLSFEIRIPCHQGEVVLPTLGSAVLTEADEWASATVRSRHGRPELTNGDNIIAIGGPDWRPLATLHGDIRIDDVDPYRGLTQPMPPDPLPDNEIQRWRETTARAWSILSRHHPDQAAELAAGMRALVPLPDVGRFRVHSASVENGFGGALMSRPPDVGVLAMTLVHEFQHSKLSAVQHLVPLVTGMFPAVHHAPWRDDPRPPSGLLQGVYAFTAVTEFWAAHRDDDNPLAQFEFAHWRGQTWETLQTLRAQPALTEWGRRFLDVLGARLEPLLSLEVSARIRELADAAAADHRASWQVCHLRPDDEFVNHAVDSWLDNRPAPDGYTAEVVPANVAQRLDVKALLSRVRITEPATYDTLRSTPDEVSGAGAGDFAYVAGDPAARKLYLAELADNPERAGAWSGLGLACAAAGQPGAHGLLERPELVRAVHLRVRERTRRAPGIEELAAWLG